MKKFFYVLALFGFSLMVIFAAADDCAAQKQPKDESAKESPAESDESFIATVDMATVFALHPLMQYFDQKVGLFIKPPKPGTTHQEFLAMIAARKADFQKSMEGNASEINRLKTEIDNLKKEVVRLNVQKYNESAAVDSKYDPQLQNTTDEVERKNISTQISSELLKISKKFDSEIAAKTKKIGDLLDSYEKIQRSLLKLYYLTPEETAKMFEAISGEIKETIKIAARKNGIRAVINVNVATPPREGGQTPPEKSIDEKTEQTADLDNLLKNGPDYTKSLNTLMAYSEGLSKDVIKTRNPQMSEKEYVEMHQKMGLAREKENAESSFFSKEQIMKLKQVKEFASTPVIYGGTDLTWFTVITIMVKNGVPKEKAEAISDVIKKQLQSE